MKILVAEDDEAIMTIYKLVLGKRKHEVFSASDGEECLSIFRNHHDQVRKEESLVSPFDLVILDHRMPKKTGLEVAQEILSVAPRQRIIIASAYASELTQRHDSDESIDRQIEMLQKPFDFEVFVELVERQPAASTVGSGIRNPEDSSSKQPPAVGPGNCDPSLDPNSQLSRMFGECPV